MIIWIAMLQILLYKFQIYCKLYIYISYYKINKQNKQNKILIIWLKDLLFLLYIYINKYFIKKTIIKIIITTLNFYL